MSKLPLSDQEEYEKLVPELNALPAKEVRKPDMPVEQAAKEGGVMAAAAKEDTAALTGVGVSETQIANLDSMVAALRYAEAHCIAAMGELKGAVQDWKNEEQAAFDLRDELIDAAFYALRNVPDAIRAVRKINQGSSDIDMVMDIQALAELTKKYRKQFEAIRFSPQIMDSAADTGARLARLYNQAFVEKGSTEATQMRNRAFTYMRDLMGKVLDAAEYAIRKDPDRLQYYYSAYRSRQRAAAAKQDEAETQAKT